MNQQFTAGLAVGAVVLGLVGGVFGYSYAVQTGASASSINPVLSPITGSGTKTITSIPVHTMTYCLSKINPISVGMSLFSAQDAVNKCVIWVMGNTDAANTVYKCFSSTSGTGGQLVTGEENGATVSEIEAEYDYWHIDGKVLPTGDSPAYLVGGFISNMDWAFQWCGGIESK